MIKRILVGIAGTPALPAKIGTVLDLGARHQAEVGLVSIVDVSRLEHVGPVPIGGESYAQRLRKSRIRRSHQADEAAVAEFEAAAQQAGVSVHVLRHEGDPLTCLAADWRYYDLCILDARNWFDHGILPEPEDALLRLIASGVRPILAVGDAHRPVKRALVCYNGSMESAKAMKQFAQMSLWPGMEVEIACIDRPKTGEEAHPMLDRAVAYMAAHGITASKRLLDGDDMDAALARAKEIEADIIVSGSSYRRILLSNRFGRNALALLKSSPLPLFLSH